MQPNGLYSKNNNHDTSQNKHQQKLSQGKTRSKQPSKKHKLSVQATKTKMRGQEPTQVEEVAPAIKQRKARNVIVSNCLQKINQAKHKTTAKNKASTQIHI